MLPVSETYEYKIDYKAIERIFDRFDLFDVQPVKNDIQADDGGGWKMTIYTKERGRGDVSVVLFFLL